MAIGTLMSTVPQHIYYMLSILCVVNDFTRKKFFMAMLAYEDDSHFELLHNLFVLKTLALYLCPATVKL
jgi:hypothetical protein